MLEFYGKRGFNVGVPLLASCVCVCRLVSSDIKEQGEECQKSFGHDGAVLHAAIHFKSARTLGDPAQPAGHGRYHTLGTNVYTSLCLTDTPNTRSLVRLITQPVGHPS